jgi:hypothetical protein
LTSTIIGLNYVAVTEIVAGSNITISPTPGIGIVTINATGGGGGGGVIDFEIASTLKYSGAFSTVALGYFAGFTQSLDAIAIGNQAGSNNQGSNAIAIGLLSGQNNQSNFAISLGTQAGENLQKKTEAHAKL